MHHSLNSTSLPTRGSFASVFLIHRIHRWLGKASVVRELDNETSEDTISNNNMGITEAQRSAAPLLLKKIKYLKLALRK